MANKINFSVEESKVELWYAVGNAWYYDGFTYWDFDSEADAEAFAERMNRAVANSQLKAVA